MSGWRRVLDAYREPRQLAVLFMGFSSGLPLALTAGTLSIWLAESGLKLGSIGLISLVAVSYSLKVFWAPVIDRMPLPFVTRWFGRRRGWALVLQVALALAILGMGMTDPAVDPSRTVLFAVIVAFFSASQDIVIDAYRIELLTAEQQGAGAAATQWGYRFGMIAASAGALYAAAFGGWHFAYSIMAALMGVGIVTVLLTPEPNGTALAPLSGSTGHKIVEWLKMAVVAPFRDFLSRRGWLAIMLFIVLYKFGDALAGVMAGPLYISLGFAKTEIAAISKVFGVIATLVGLALGGAVVARWGLFRALLICGVLQNVSTLMYAVLAHAGHDNSVLALSILLENVTGGLGSAAFVAFISQLCRIEFTATQYALLSSLASVGRTTLASSGGFLAERLGWQPFFVLAAFAGAPALLVLLWLMRGQKSGANIGQASTA